MPPAVVAAVVIAGAAMSAASSIKQGADAQAASIEQKKMIGQEVAANNLDYGSKIISDDSKTSNIISSNAANAGAAGLSSDSINPVQRGSLQQAQIRNLYTRYAGRQAAANLAYQGALTRYEGDSALTAGIMGGSMNLLKGGMSAYGASGASSGSAAASSSSNSIGTVK